MIHSEVLTTLAAAGGSLPCPYRPHCPSLSVFTQHTLSYQVCSSHQRVVQTYPLLPGASYHRHHSLVNDPASPSIFVVQHSSQAYPAYLIDFH
jgi:hypothetical protein